jgi:hypothetical protein
MNNSSPTTLLLQDLISAPNKAESILECLTSEQINMIENTINRIKRRKMDKSSHLPSPMASPPTTSLKEEDDIVMENSSSAAAIANALAAAMVSAALQVPVSTVSAKNNSNAASTTTASATTVSPAKTTNNNSTTPVTSNDPIAEVKDGVEWVSFVYSHNRTLKRYSIRTDIQKVTLDVVDDKFKAENCVCILFYYLSKFFGCS